MDPARSGSGSHRLGFVVAGRNDAISVSGSRRSAFGCVKTSACRGTHDPLLSMQSSAALSALSS
jgi:hypothetical protein